MGVFSDAVKSEASSYADSEWTGTLGTATVTIYAKPLTPADLARLGPKHAGFVNSPTLEGMVDLIIAKARDGHNVLAFDKGDKPLMMRWNTNKVGEIFAALFGEQMETLNEDDAAQEERAKN
jgi:precorrin-4 methylase